MIKTNILATIILLTCLSCEQKNLQFGSEKASGNRTIQGISEQDTSYEKSSKVVLGNLTNERVEDLVLLGKIWGFLKYHHPKVASGELNWDFELFRVLANYAPGMKPQQRDSLMVNWINSLGELPECRTCHQKPKSKIIIPADLNWIKDRALSAGLRKSLEDVYNHRNQSDNYYIDHVFPVGNPEFKNENPYAHFKYPDEGYRLLCLYRFWNIIEYFFPYRDVIGEDWTGVMREFIPQMAGASNALEYKLCTRRLIGRINDSHANLWIKDEEMVRYFGKYRPAIQVKFIENQAVVTGYYHKEHGPKTGLSPGDIIIAIEGVPVEEIVKTKLQLYPASNYSTKLRNIARDLLRSNSTTLHLQVRRENKTSDFALPCFNDAEEKFETFRDYAYNRPDSSYQLLSPAVGYIYCGTLKNQVIPQMMEKLKDTKGLIFDLRNYPKDFLVFELTRYLKTKPSEFVYFSTGNVRNPGLFTKGKVLKCGEKNPHAYKGKVVILVNEITQSSAEYTAMALQSVPGAVVAGSTTSGADGNVSEFVLPGQLGSMITGIGVYYPDGRPTQRVGIVPDYVVTPTIAGVKAGRDEVLEYAIQLIEKQ